jgi:ornithine cyclodeaminase/alanine dehydrogenase-like protein (mu-crystallin family)
MLRTLLLSSDDIAEVARVTGVGPLMIELIERLHLAIGDGHEYSYSIPARSGFHYESPASGLVEWMPLWQRDKRVMMKMVGYHPANPSVHGIPTVLSTTSLFDTQTGHLVAMMDGTLSTAFRTGAASAVASRLLANPDSRTLGLIGCGAQAVTQLHALSQVFDFDEVCIFDIDADAVASLAERCSLFCPESLTFHSCSIADLIAKADILCTATSVGIGEGPVFAEDLPRKPWLHINSVGSDLPGKTEVPRSVLQAATVVPDFLAQAKVEGECQQLTESEIGPGISEVARNPSDYAMLQQQLTVFDSTGFALEDLVVMELFLKHASEHSIGTEIGIESLSKDPRNPYGSLHPHPATV